MEWTDQRHWGLWAVRTDGSEAHEITPDPPNEYSSRPRGAVLSPDGLEVAYVTYEYKSPKYCVEVAAVDGGRSEPVFCTPWGAENLAWSPNGYELAFNAEATGSKGQAIFIANLRSGVTRKVADWFAYQEEPTFSPDGSELAFFSAFNPDEELERGTWLADADGSNIRFLSPDGKQPAWSPTGSEIAVASYDEESPVEDEGAIALINSSSGATERWLLNEDGLEEFNPQWSPDGESLFFTRCTGSSCLTGHILADGRIWLCIRGMELNPPHA